MQTSRPRRGLLIAGGLLVLIAAIWRVEWMMSRVLAGEAWRQAATPAPVWRPATAGERAGVMASIRAQLEAFRKDDYRRAVGYQSTILRANFPTVSLFRSMMKANYPQFASYKRVQFGPARASTAGDRVQIGAAVTGRDGVRVQAVYDMVREQGVYRVAGVLGGARPRLLPNLPALSA